MKIKICLFTTSLVIWVMTSFAIAGGGGHDGSRVISNNDINLSTSQELILSGGGNDDDDRLDGPFLPNLYFGPLVRGSLGPPIFQFPQAYYDEETDKTVRILKWSSYPLKHVGWSYYIIYQPEGRLPVKLANIATQKGKPENMLFGTEPYEVVLKRLVNKAAKLSDPDAKEIILIASDAPMPQSAGNASVVGAAGWPTLGLTIGGSTGKTNRAESPIAHFFVSIFETMGGPIDCIPKAPKEPPKNEESSKEPKEKPPKKTEALRNKLETSKPPLTEKPEPSKPKTIKPKIKTKHTPPKKWSVDELRKAFGLLKK